MSGFRYKTIDLNEIIGVSKTIINLVPGSQAQYIADTASNSALSQYYNPLTNTSGAVANSSTSIARLYSNTSYTILQSSQDIKNSVISYYSDINTSGEISSLRPSWCNSCSVIVIGGGGSGASGQQGFQKQDGQKKDSQQGRPGGAGGAGGMMSSYNIALSQGDLIYVSIGSGGIGTTLPVNGNGQNGFNGEKTSFEVYPSQPPLSAPRIKLIANGGLGGKLGSSNAGASGVGGLGGNGQISIGIPPIETSFYEGVKGQDGNPYPNIFLFSNGGNIKSDSYNNILPYQIVSNGGGNQQQQQVGNQIANFVESQGYGAGGVGGAAGNSNSPGPNGSQGGPGAQGFVRIYWLYIP
jgi:hypothetical protein